MTLFWNQAGPMLQYKDGTLFVSDLNPELHTQWRMSRWEMFKLGLRFILASSYTVGEASGGSSSPSAEPAA